MKEPDQQKIENNIRYMRNLCEYIDDITKAMMKETNIERYAEKVQSAICATKIIENCNRTNRLVFEGIAEQMKKSK